MLAPKVKEGFPPKGDAKIQPSGVKLDGTSAETRAIDFQS